MMRRVRKGGNGRAGRNSTQQKRHNFTTIPQGPTKNGPNSSNHIPFIMTRPIGVYTEIYRELLYQISKTAVSLSVCQPHDRLTD